IPAAFTASARREAWGSIRAALHDRTAELTLDRVKLTALEFVCFVPAQRAARAQPRLRPLGRCPGTRGHSELRPAWAPEAQSHSWRSSNSRFWQCLASGLGLVRSPVGPKTTVLVNGIDSRKLQAAWQGAKSRKRFTFSFAIFRSFSVFFAVFRRHSFSDRPKPRLSRMVSTPRPRVDTTVLSAAPSGFVCGIEHRHHICRRHIGQDVVDLLEHEAAAGAPNVFEAAHMIANLS